MFRSRRTAEVDVAWLFEGSVMALQCLLKLASLPLRVVTRN